MGGVGEHVFAGKLLHRVNIYERKGGQEYCMPFCESSGYAPVPGQGHSALFPGKDLSFPTLYVRRGTLKGTLSDTLGKIPVMRVRPHPERVPMVIII